MKYIVTVNAFAKCRITNGGERVQGNPDIFFLSAKNVNTALCKNNLKRHNLSQCDEPCIIFRIF